MTLNDLLEDARRQLAPIYEKREMENVLTLLCEELLSLRGYRLQKNMVLHETQIAAFRNAVARLATHEPIQYVLGYADFYGMKLKVNPHVLIPRPETEELVIKASRILEAMPHSEKITVLDIGTGSGCIAIALKKTFPSIKVTALEHSPEALQVAQENASAHNCMIHFVEADFLRESTWNMLGVFHFILSNPPYITRQEFRMLDARVRNYEPRKALMADDPDPFIFYSKIASFLAHHLHPNGYCLLELNSMHASAVASVFSSSYPHVVIEKDMYNNERFLIVRKNLHHAHHHPAD
ncbi:MAG: release factor glutamine methyltransferase [Chitinophagales bacterium]|nr:MAG: release factor glutamine methyltransferase [Chitinophagales bacterium]